MQEEEEHLTNWLMSGSTGTVSVSASTELSSTVRNLGEKMQRSGKQMARKRQGSGKDPARMRREDVVRRGSMAPPDSELLLGGQAGLLPLQGLHPLQQLVHLGRQVRPWEAR